MVIFENKIDRKSNNSSYHYSQIIIHWLVALLVIYQFTFGGNIEFLELESCINSKTNALKSCQHLNNHYLVRLSHYLIYLILFSMPVFGMYMYYFNSDISQFLHITFSKILLFLILLHICAVAFHEGVLGSKLFYRMASLSKKGDK